MAIKIKRIDIQNFKVFSNRTFDFSNSNFVILDGPNGFGKTSFYDAVELLITGEIRRYKILGSEVVDNRLSYKENPYLHRDVPHGDIIIKGVFEINGKEITLSRKALNSNLNNSHLFDCFKLFIVSESGEENEYSKIEEITKLSDLFGNNYCDNFKFLNYVEQEDSIFLLKNKEKEKHSQIAHLFNVEKFKTKLDKLKEVKKKIVPLCKKDVEKKIKTKQKELAELKKNIIDKSEESYSELFVNENYYWDKDKIDFPENRYSELLGEEGIITRLKSLLINKETYKNYLFNKKINILLNNRKDINNLLKYYNFIDQKDNLKYTKETCNNVNILIAAFNKIVLEDFSKKNVIISDTIRKDILKTYTIKQYDDALKVLEEKQKSVSELDTILANLKESRDTLKLKLEEYQAKEGGQNECPFCGTVWKDAKELTDNIELQSAKIRTLLTKGSNELNDLFNQFKAKEVKAVIQELQQYNENNKIDIEFIENLETIDTINLKSLKSSIDALSISIVKYLSIVPKQKESLKTEDLLTVIKSKLKTVDDEKIKVYFNDIFTEFFNDKSTRIDDISINALDSKITYIEWQYSKHKNKVIIDLIEEITLAEDQYKRAKELSKKLKRIIDIYSESIKFYSSKLIQDIEILFHIYSGRIVQDFQGGLGLFIDNKKGIKFLTDPLRSYDAIFSMSSGQLSALIISFTLALNKKYSQNKVLLIDDPVQTMDELNIAGFIDLLRNEFSDRQIFISTHEEVMSTFMRYKFEKYGHKTLRINVRGSVV